MIIQKQRGHHSAKLRNEDFAEIADKIYGTSSKTGYLRKIFGEGDSVKFTFLENTLEPLVSFLAPEFDYKSFAQFRQANEECDEVKKYEESAKLRQTKGDFLLDEQKEINDWAKKRCEYLFEQNKRQKEGKENKNLESDRRFANDIPTVEQLQQSKILIESDETVKDELKNYLERKLKQFEFISLPIAPDETRIGIDKISVPSLGCDDRFEDLLSKKYFKSPRERIRRYRIKIQEELEVIERMLVVAEGGIGKTTLCKWLFHYSAQRVINDDEPYFPIHIDLKNAGSLESIFDREIGDFKLSFSEVRELLKSYIPIFICDGLDEVTDKSTQVIKDLKEIGNQFDDCKVVIFSRDCHYINDFYAQGFSKYDIEESNNEELPGLIIKGDEASKDFKQYEREAQLPPEIQSNYLLYTSFILHYIRNGKIERHPTKGKILNTLIDEYYFRNWELADVEVRKHFPEHFDNNHILNLLTAIALISKYRALFSNLRTQDYQFEDVLVMTKSGYTYPCLKNIIELCISERGEVIERLITFYCDSGMLIRNPDGIYQFTNKLVEDYFSARGVFKLCFNGEQIGPFASKSVGIRILFATGEDSTMEIVAGLLSEPSRTVNSIYIDYPDWMLHLALTDYMTRLCFAAIIIGVRNNEISAIVKAKVIRQLSDCIVIFNVKSKLTIRSRIIRSFSRIKQIYLIRALIDTKDILAFEPVYDYFKRNGDKSDGTQYWSYFLLFPDHPTLYAFCSEVLIKEVYLSASKIYRGKRWKYLHQYQPLEMVAFYFKAFTNPKDYAETIFHSKNPEKIYSKYISYLWDSISSDEDTSLQMAGVVLNQALKSDNKTVLDLCEEFIRACPDSMKNKHFFNPIFQLIREAKEIDELKKLLSLLRICSNIPANQLQAYNSDFESLFNAGNFETKIHLLDFCCRSPYSTVIDKQDLLPFIAKELPRGLTSSDPDAITLSLCFLQSCSPEVITDVEMNLLPTFLNHEDERIRLYAMMLISKWRLEKYIGEVFLFAFFSKEDAVIPIASAIKFLIDMGIQYYYLIIVFNRYEAGIQEQVEVFQKMHDEYLKIAKEFPEIKSLYSRYRDCITFFEHCGTPKSIQFLEQLREFLYDKDMHLDRLIIGAIHNIEMHTRKFELFAKRNPEKMVKFKEEIDKMEAILKSNKKADGENN